MRTFIHFVVEELFLVRKLALLKEIRRVDNKMAKKITSLNALRNAMAHSFFPNMKRDYRKTKKVMWNDRDIFTVEGFKLFVSDMFELTNYLFEMHFGKSPAEPYAARYEIDI